MKLGFLPVFVILWISGQCGLLQSARAPCPPKFVCVPKSECRTVHKGPQDEYSCGTNGQENYVCCLSKQFAVGKRPSGPPRRSNPYRRPYMDFYQPAYEKVTGYKLSKTAKSLLKDYRHRDECGVRGKAPNVGRISTGYIKDLGFAEYGEFKWVAGILVCVKQKSQYGRYGRNKCSALKYHCGATLISSSMVVTAAHCVKGQRPEDLRVHLGDWNLHSTRGELLPAIERRVGRLHIHSGYNPATYLNDIALVQLSRRVDLNRTPHISTACLPDSNFNFENDLKCYIAGWGDDIYKPNFGSNLLRAVSVTYTADEEECQNKLFGSVKHLNFKFHLDTDVQACIIGGYGRDACLGDGGGAVVCPLSNEDAPGVCTDDYCASEHYFIAGIISYGTPVCGENSVTIITNIVENVNWINTIQKTTVKTYHKPHKSYSGRTAVDNEVNTGNSTTVVG